LATPKPHWVAAKLVERLLATPKPHWVAAKLVERLLATPKPNFLNVDSCFCSCLLCFFDVCWSLDSRELFFS
jgi:hypothetical protein